MIEFLLLVLLIVNIVILGLSISTLKTQDENKDIMLDIERNQKRIEKLFYRKGRR